MEARSAIAQLFISQEIGRALMRARLSHDHAIRTELENGAVIVGIRDATVRIAEGDGSITLDDRIRQLKHDPRYAATFPQPAAKVSRDDMRELTKNFDKIAAGAIAVE
jgi:hypothetical protein